MTLKKRKQGVEISFARFMEVVVFVTVVCCAADSTGVPDVVCVNILIFTWTKLDEPSKLPSRGGGEGYSHTLPIRVCAAQRGRDFEAPDVERGIHFRGVC